MLSMNIILITIFIPLCISDTPYLLRSYPTESVVNSVPFMDGPCFQPLKTLSFLQGADNESFEHNECIHDSGESILTCKLGVKNATASLDLENYPLDDIKVLILFVQEFIYGITMSRVLDLCFLSRFGKSLQELAICGYKPPAVPSLTHTSLHILDVPALAIFASNIQTLLICSVDVWQSVELRQFTSLKHLLIMQAATIQMRYYHSPHCADCVDAHPKADFSFHYLIPLSSQLTYFLIDVTYAYDTCKYDLLKTIRSSKSSISTFIIASQAFDKDQNAPICETCDSGLCPLLAVCLDKNSAERRNPDKPFECLCIEDVKVADEFISCKPMTIHPPMYSTRCNHTPSFWKYITPSMTIATSYISTSIIVFIISTIFLLKSKLKS